MLFRRKNRSRTILALFVLGMVQLSGIDGVLYYAPILFAQAGISSQEASFLASGVSAILMLLVSIPAFLFADKMKRRTSIISGGLGLSACMILIGSLYASNSVHAYGSARWVVVVLIFVFALTYCYTIRSGLSSPTHRLLLPLLHLHLAAESALSWSPQMGTVRRR